MTKIKPDLDNLLKRYKELEFIINKSPVVVFLWKNEEDWPVEFVSENITQFGYTRDEFMSGKIKYSEIIYPEDLERVAKEVMTYSETDLTEFTQEYRIFSKSKDILWVDDRTFIRRNPDGEITHFQGIVLDITEKKKIQEELESSEQKFRGISDQLLVGVGILQDGKIVYANKKATEIFGYSLEEMRGWPTGGFSRTIHPDDLEREVENINKIQNDPNTDEIQFKTRGIKKSGEYFYAEAIFKKFQYNKRPALIGMFIDITEQVKAETDLRFTKYTLDHSNEPAICSDDKGNIIYVNEASCKLTGYTYDELLKMRIFDINPTIEEINWLPLWENIKEKGSLTFESLGTNRKGEIFPIEIFVNYIKFEGKEYNCAYVHNISDRKEAEKKLKESEEKFRQISEQLLVSVGILQDNKVIYANKKLCELLGYEYEELINWTFEDFHKVIHPDCIEEEMRLINQIIQDPAQQEIQFRSKATKKSGEIIWAENLFKKIMYNGHPALLGMFIDITEKLEADYALKLTQFAIDHSVDPAFWMDDQFQIIYVNEALCKSLGYTHEELLNMKGLDLNPTYPKEAWEPTWEKIKEEGSFVIETYHQKKDGVLFPVEVYISYLQYDNKGYNCAFAHDISDRKKSERKLKESEEKYREAFYRENFYKDLFTHDMSNILQAINTSFELYEHNLKSKMGALQNNEFFETIPFQINRATHLINNIKKFSELDIFEQSLTRINIYQIVQQNINNIQSLSKNKRVSIKIEPKIQLNFLILGNELLNEAIENILLNSIIHNDNEEVCISIRIQKVLREQNPYIKVEFSDNGRGIEDSRKRIIFNRAYNQDKSTIGMGLGLSLVRMIIEKLDGIIWVEDRVLDDYMQGSKFIVLLPEVD